MKFPCRECTNPHCDAPNQRCSECLERMGLVAHTKDTGPYYYSGTFNGSLHPDIGVPYADKLWPTFAPEDFNPFAGNGIAKWSLLPAVNQPVRLIKMPPPDQFGCDWSHRGLKVGHLGTVVRSHPESDVIEVVFGMKIGALHLCVGMEHIELWVPT